MHTRTATWPEPFHPDEATPCDGCHFAARCQADKMACDALVIYMQDASPLRWKIAPRAPTRTRYLVMARQLRKRLAA